MTLSLASVLPNLHAGLANTGFLFGAGTSSEAGYPLMAHLTRTVIAGLTVAERKALDEALASAATSYDDPSASPNIERIADIVVEHALNSGIHRFSDLESRLRTLVTEAIVNVKVSTLDDHLRFLTLLKRRAFGRPACVYIFTTNYDVLFELAAAQVGVFVETGFAGSVERFFDPQRFSTASGVLRSNRFVEHSTLTVRLIKLHGSISWLSRNGEIFEVHPAAIAAADRRVMVLPRRRKVRDTLQPPYDQLFTVARRVLGTGCKYLVSCGFSYGDDHINHDLLMPAVNGAKIKLFALCAEETEGMTGIKNSPSFSAGFSSSGVSSGTVSTNGTDCWRFSRFVNLFASSPFGVG